MVANGASFPKTAKSFVGRFDDLSKLSVETFGGSQMSLHMRLGSFL